MTNTASSTLRRDLKWHPDGGRDGGLVVEDDISGRFTRLSRAAADAARSGQAMALRMAGQHRLCRDRRVIQTSNRLDPRHLFSLKFQFIRGDAVAAWLAGWTDAVFSVPAIMFWSIVGAFVAAGLVAHVDSLQLALVGDQSSGAVLSWRIGAVLLFTKLLHEFSHAAVCRRMGAKVRSMGVMFFFGMPCPYCDVTDAWRLPQRHRRAAVMAAGVYIEWVVATIAGIIFLSVQHGPTQQVAAIAIVVCFLGSVLFNANPMMRYDGYYVMADWLGSVNLSVDAASAFDALVTRRLLGLPSTRTANRRTIGLAIYHAGRVVYRLFVMASICGLVVYAGASVGMQRLAMGLVACLLIAGASQPTLRVARFVTGPAGGGSPPAWRRITIMALLPGLVIALLVIPFPSWTRVHGTVTPTRVQEVQSQVDGVVESMDVMWGQSIKKGEVIASVRSEPLELREITLKDHLSTTTSRLDSAERAMASGDDDSAGDRWRALDQQRLSLDAQWVSLRKQAAEATLRAEWDGIILGPTQKQSIKSRSSSEDANQALHPSHGDVGQVVRTGESLARVASQDWCVELDWSLADSPPVSIGDSVIVTLAVEDGTTRTHAFKIDLISPIRNPSQDVPAKIRLRCLPTQSIVIPPDRLASWMDSPADAVVIHPRESLTFASVSMDAAICDDRGMAVSGDDSKAAIWPTPAELMPVRVIASPHLSLLSVDDLSGRLQVRFVRRGGPGGQHRNKVSTGVFLHDPVTGVSGEATESRSQRTNRSEAMTRLRMAASISLRTNQECPIERSVRERLLPRRLKISASSDDHAAAMTLLLNDLHRAGGQPSLVAPIWKCSGGAVVRLVKREPAAWRWLQDVRKHHGRLPLRT